MESAIPKHLQQPRLHPAATPAHYQPPYPAWAARFDPLIGQVVMAYFGVQGEQPVPLSALAEVTTRLRGDNAPGHWDAACCTDAAGYHNTVAIAYWADIQAFERWREGSGFNRWWQDSARETGPLGWFIEVVCPTADRFETVFSSAQVTEGIGHLASHLSAPIVEHGYWGSARDRLAIAQREELAGSHVPMPAPSGRRVRVSGRDNLCLIRSGQDWSATTGHERHLYLGEVQPTLAKGMTFLRDEGGAIGCLNCRFMQVLDPQTGTPLEKTFGLAYFQELAQLESWAKTHPTHVAIFGGFMQYVQTLNFDIQLRLYHEVAVIPAAAQYFEYLNCHPATGLIGRA
ncbi:phenylacetaldoxime dehydratase family protein [Pseudomonas sp. nanlin1]|uniref:phenylacetaldoxime dehydratase family protein n=1 Tax=Pseudomonas sp. nanlin1 TaxID=3040605 RepID=UPI00388FE0F2